MNEEILKMAKESGLLLNSAKSAGQGLEAFYKAAYNAGIEAAAKVATDYIEHGGYQFLKEIRKLKMKP